MHVYCYRLGKTSEFNYFHANGRIGKPAQKHEFYLVDLPGVGYAEVRDSSMVGRFIAIYSFQYVEYFTSSCRYFIKHFIDFNQVFHGHVSHGKCIHDLYQANEAKKVGWLDLLRKFVTGRPSLRLVVCSDFALLFVGCKPCYNPLITLITENINFVDGSESYQFTHF